MPETDIFPCPDCASPQVLAQGIDYYCPSCPPMIEAAPMEPETRTERADRERRTLQRKIRNQRQELRRLNRVINDRGHRLSLVYREIEDLMRGRDEWHRRYIDLQYRKKRSLLDRILGI